MILVDKNFARRDYEGLSNAETRHLKKTRKEVADNYRKLRKSGPFKPMKDLLDKNKKKALDKAKELAGMEKVIPESEQQVIKNLPQNYYKVNPKKVGFFKRNKKALTLAAGGTALAGAGLMAYRHYKNKDSK